MPVKQRNKPIFKEEKKCVHKKDVIAGDTKSQPTPKKPLVSWRRVAIRIVFIIGAAIAAAFYSVRHGSLDGKNVIASANEVASRKGVRVKCSTDYNPERALFPECIPRRCGRLVMDGVVTNEEATLLLKMAKAGLDFGGSNGGASILDMHSGALSKEDKFINIYSVLDPAGEQVFSEADFVNYRKVKTKILSTVALEFEVPPHKLYLTKPTFFSRMNNKPAKTLHDEYWHTHVDKETYGSFHYTSLLYLSTYGTDFTGGRFTFVNKRSNSTVEPKFGRLSFFTSGSENPHFVEKVESGTRFAITVSFTCDPEKAIQDPGMQLVRHHTSS